MGERDAFGREKGEDPLAGLGWGTSTPAPDAPPAPVRATPSAPATPPRLRRRRPRGFVRLIVFLAVIVVVAATASSVLDRGRDAIDDLESAIRGAVPTVAPPPPAGLEGTSLLRPAALRAALAKLPAGRIEMLRVAPERIDAQVSADGRMELVQVTADGRVTTVSTPAASRGEFVKVDAAAPSRIVRVAARRSGRDPASVSYLVLMRLAGKSEWQLFFADGLHFSASASGKRVRRVG
jgi:hypothetical protein